MRKYLICFFLLVVVLWASSCGDVTAPETQNDKILDEQTNAVSEGTITVNYDPRIQEKLFRAPFDFQLSEAMKEKGFLSVEKHENGFAVYTIERKNYDAFITQLGASKKAILDAFPAEYTPYVTSVTYNDALTEMTIAVNRADYENISYESESGYMKIQNCITGCVNNTAQYHSFSVGEFQKCEIKIVDSVTQDVLKTICSPDVLLNG